MPNLLYATEDKLQPVKQKGQPKQTRERVTEDKVREKGRGPKNVVMGGSLNFIPRGIGRLWSV